METINLKSWEAFEKVINDDIEWKQANQKPHKYISDMLYRGHASSKWKLETSLERVLKKEHKDESLSWEKYHRILQSIDPAIRSFTNHQYEVLDFTDQNTSRFVPPAYEFMVYIRHHGFPSPLLDWSASPYVAAFFAFQEANEETDIAIFSYREYLGRAKGGWSGQPKITQLGAYAHTHKRHFLQQCQYTICTIEKEQGDTIKKYYSRHEDAEFRHDQDLLRKYVIPSNEKLKVLRKLESMNINSYSLFGTEESLMATLAFREITAN